MAVTLAARAALRVLPIAQTASRIEIAKDFPAKVALPIFRANCVAWCAAKYPDQATDLREAASSAADASFATNFFVASSFAVPAAVSTTSAASYAAASAANAGASAANAGASTTDAASAVSFTFLAAIAAADKAASVTFWTAVSHDATHIDNGAIASDLVNSSLWPNQQPQQIADLWHEMRRDLLAANQDWDVWIIWYEDRRFGYVRNKEQELAYALIENELWEQGPAVVNAEIKRRIEEVEPPLPPVEALPEQESAATRFDVNSQGLIDVVPDPPAPETLADALQRDLYGETRFKAQTLVHLGPNQLGDVSDLAARFLENLPEGLEDVSIKRAWSRANTLRSRLKAYDSSLSNGEPDPAHLPPLVAETLRDLIETWNVFIVGDPHGRELDAIRLGPQDVRASKDLNALAAPIIDDLQHSEGMATSGAIEALVEQHVAAKQAAPNIHGDQAIELARKTSGNFIAAVLRRAYAAIREEAKFAWKEGRAGVYRWAGPATIAGIAYNWTAIASFVARNADAFKAFGERAWHNPTIPQIVDAIVRALP